MGGIGHLQKKTDPEDIWIECPQTKINEGYWTGKIIPAYIAEFIIWLDLFFPNIPEFYLDQLTLETQGSTTSKKKKKKKTKSNKGDKSNKDKESKAEKNSDNSD